MRRNLTKRSQHNMDSIPFSDFPPGVTMRDIETARGEWCDCYECGREMKNCGETVCGDCKDDPEI